MEEIHGRSRPSASGQKGRCREMELPREEQFWEWSFLSDFTNEMGRVEKTDGTETKGILALCFLKSPSMAIFP